MDAKQLMFGGVGLKIALLDSFTPRPFTRYQELDLKIPLRNVKDKFSTEDNLRFVQIERKYLDRFNTVEIPFPVVNWYTVLAVQAMLDVSEEDAILFILEDALLTSNNRSCCWRNDNGVDAEAAIPTFEVFRQLTESLSWGLVVKAAAQMKKVFIVWNFNNNRATVWNSPIISEDRKQLSRPIIISIVGNHIALVDDSLFKMMF